MTVGVLPPTRILSWQQLVQDADPDWNRLKQRPWIYHLSNGRRFLGRPDIYTAPADGNPPIPPGPAPIVQNVVLLSTGGVVYMVSSWQFPTSSSGLLPGQIYWDGGVLTIVPGGAFDPLQPALFLSSDPSALLVQGAGSMPTTDPATHNNRLWNNNGVVCVAT